MTQTNNPSDPKTPTPLSADAPHRPADDTEEVYYEGSPLMRGAIRKNEPWILGGLALIVLPLAYHYGLHKHINHIAFIVIVLLGLLMVCVPPLWALTIRVRITNYRIDYERGLIGKDIDTLELWHVEDIHYNQTMMDRILGIGTIRVISHDRTTPRLELHSLPHSRHLFDQLKQRIIAVKRQRGVMKIDTGT
jgi:hypothetical protein